MGICHDNNFCYTKSLKTHHWKLTYMGQNCPADLTSIKFETILRDIFRAVCAKEMKPH